MKLPSSRCAVFNQVPLSKSFILSEGNFRELGFRCCLVGCCCCWCWRITQSLFLKYDGMIQQLIQRVCLFELEMNLTSCLGIHWRSCYQEFDRLLGCSNFCWRAADKTLPRMDELQKRVFWILEESLDGIPFLTIKPIVVLLRLNAVDESVHSEIKRISLISVQMVARLPYSTHRGEAKLVASAQI